MPKEAKPKRKAAEKSEAKTRGKRTKKEDGAPKRGLSAYMFFSQDWRERIKTENPEAQFGEIGKLLGAKWKEMDEPEREPYNEMAKKDRVRAETEKKAWDAGGGAKKKEVAAPVSDEDED